MSSTEVIAVDLGQSGCRIRQGEKMVTTERGKLVGESPVDSLHAVFSENRGFKGKIVELYLTGLNRTVSNVSEYASL